MIVLTAEMRILHSYILSFTKGFGIERRILCGIDLISLSITDGLAGFKAFLDAYSGTFQPLQNSTDWQTRFAFRINNTLFEGAYNRGAKRLSIKVGALKQYSDTSISYKHWLFLQQLYRYYGASLNINEMHFAVDLPYQYSDITIKPAACVYKPQYLSTRYFDTKRGQGKPPKDGYDDFVIYDKCRKCRIGIPLTRIELRLPLREPDLLEDPSIQSKIAKRVSKKFDEIRIYKGRSRIRLSLCDWNDIFSYATSYIKGDSSKYKFIAKHRSESIEHSGEVFKAFMRHCRENHIFTGKPQRHMKAKPFLATLSPEDRVMLNKTIAAYNKYDTQWYRDTKFKMGSDKTRRVRLTDEIRDKVLFMIQQGQTQASIAKELDVSESTVSRWLNGYVRLEDSIFLLW
jgi:DNA-binding MarR family transcriptional regulator